MGESKKFSILVFVVVLYIAASNATATTIDYFDDGQVHVINYHITQHAIISDNSNGNLTTVFLVADGSIGEDLLSYGDSIFIQSGGGIGRDIKIYNNSNISISDGAIGRDFLIYNSSRIKISGGIIYRSVASSNTSYLKITGGSKLRSISGYNESQTILTGGSTAENIITNDYSYALLSGGFVDGILNPKHNSQITVYGSDFNYPLGYIADVSGTLTGTLANGDMINIVFIREGNGAILLANPNIADFDYDGIVNFVDFATFASYWQNTDCAILNNCEGADFGPDGDVDLEDLKQFASNWLDKITP